MMRWTSLLVQSLLVLCASLPAQADVLGSKYATGKCLDAKNSVEAIVWDCHGGSNQQVSFSGYGAFKVGGRCLGAAGQSMQQGEQLVFAACNKNNLGQRWAFYRGALRNELGYCADIKGGSVNAGTPVVAWSCHGGANQQWGLGTMARSNAPQLTSLPPGTSFKIKGADLVDARSGRVVAAGGGNVVAAGGLNVIAPGGGNVVAAGGLNVIAPGGGNVVAVGGGNFISFNK